MTMYRAGRVAALSAALAAVLLTGVVSAVDMPGANADPAVSADRAATSSTRGALTPVAKPDSITIWPKHEYNLTRRVLKNDVADGCTLRIASVLGDGDADTFIWRNGGRLKFYVRGTSADPRSSTFDYSVECVENGVKSSLVTNTVTVRPAFLVTNKWQSEHRYKFVNRNSTYVVVRQWARHHKLLAKYRIPAHSSKIYKRPHVYNKWEAWLGKVKSPMGSGWLERW